MPTPGRPGSTTAWRKLRRYVAARDGMVCRRPLCPCGGGPLTWAPRQPNTVTLGHVVAYVDGGSDHPENLRAECSQGSHREGADRTNRRKARSRLNTSRGW